MQKRSQLIIFIKNPVLGKVKTRLAATVGDVKALEVYNELLLHTKNVTLPLSVNKKVYYTSHIDQQDIWNGKFYEKDLQIKDGSLGDKMGGAFRQSINDGFDKSVIIGSDCSEITTDIIQEAFDKLDEVDIVIGPATDGGYYLLGMKNYFHQIFQNKNWSTSSVFSDTMKDIKELKLSFYQLPILSDIDTEEDLELMVKNNYIQL